MSGYEPPLKFYSFRRNRNSNSARVAGALLATAIAGFFSPTARAQQTHPAETPVIVQPGAPGTPSKTLPSSTRATLPQPIAGGRGVHAGHDHASLASGGDDGADSVAHREQGVALAGRANQQLAIGRNQVYAAVAGDSRRTDFDGDAGNADENAGDGQKRRSFDASDGSDARHADA